MRDSSQQQNEKSRDTSTLSPSLWRGVFGILLVAAWLGGSQWSSAQESGKQIFQKACAACHSIGAGKLVGPDLAGVNDRRAEDWLIKFPKSSQALIKSGDKTAVALFEEFNKMPMPDQALSDDQIKKILAHIKEAGGSSAAAGKDAAPSAPAAATAAAAPRDAIQLGEDLFQGKIRFANGGPSCNACHHVTNDALLGGGVLAAELSLVFSRMGKQGLSAILAGGSPFPVMQTAYAGKEFSDKEINALVGFLQHVDQEHARQLPREWGWRMFSAGVGGVVVLVIVFSLAGRRRKKRCVNQDIYDRQVASE